MRRPPPRPLDTARPGTDRAGTDRPWQSRPDAGARQVDGVAVHTGAKADALARSVDARAVTWGRHIAFADGEYRPGTPGGDAVLAHELAHARQQASHAEASDHVDPASLPVATDAAGERAADAWSLATMLGTPRPRQGSAGLALAACQAAPAGPGPDPVDQALRGLGAWTPALAVQAVQAYDGASMVDRQALVERYIGFGQFGPMLNRLPVGSTGPGGTYEAPVRDMLQRIQRTGARADAATQGLANEGAMAQAQATEMTNRNTAAAAAALPVNAPPPTPAQVAAQQATQVASSSIAPQTAVMSAATETAVNNTLNTVSIPAFVTWCTANHPGLGITAAHLRADARAIFDRGAGILAFADQSGTVSVVGESFATAVAANPAYVLPTVVHELWGHNTYGAYGDPGVEYGLELYDRAAALMPGYTAPAAGSAARLSEIDAYAYQETEMYSLMREVPYFTPNAPADVAALASVNYDPGPAIGGRVQMIHDQWEPRVARSLLRGLYLRFMADPTVGGPAMNAFRAGVRAAFPAADAAVILQ